MGIDIKVNAFEGPLDLLLHLIEKNKVDIYDIPISEITSQYLDYIRSMEEEDLDVMSDFLVMAATLLKIKAKMLLPVKEEEEEEGDPREELVRRLIEYKIYKYASLQLKEREMTAEKSFFRSPDIPPQVLAYREEIDPVQMLSEVTLQRISEVFQFVMRKRQDKLDPIRSEFGEIKQEEIKLEDKITEVYNYIIQYKEVNFYDLLNEQETKEAVIVTFLAVLELMKTGKIYVQQEISKMIFSYGHWSNEFMKNKLAAIEGILFSMGTSVTRRQLMEALEIDDEQFDELIKLLQIEYDKEERGIRLLELDDAYQLCTKTEYYGSLIRIVNHPKKPRLTDVMLETLSIIAYKQPVTKQEIEAIRGVKCDHPINKLLEYRLIKEAGRLDAIGRPILFRTTEEFLRCFGVKSTDDLPVVGEEQVEDFKIQAQEEVKYTLDETSLEEEMEEM